MLLAQSFLYRGKKVSLRVDKITTRGTIYIEGKVAAVMDTTEIGLLRTEAESIVNKEIYGDIYNIGI